MNPDENPSYILSRIIRERYEQELAAKKNSVLETIQTFARQFSDKPELTEREIGFAEAMLQVSDLLQLKLDDLTDTTKEVNKMKNQNECRARAKLKKLAKAAQKAQAELRTLADTDRTLSNAEYVVIIRAAQNLTHALVVTGMWDDLL